MGLHGNPGAEAEEWYEPCSGLQPKRYCQQAPLSGYTYCFL